MIYTILASLLPVAFGVGGRVGAASGRKELARLRSRCAELQRSIDLRRQSSDGLARRHRSAEEMVRNLQRSIAELPEIAQRLIAARDLPRIPERVLELIQEVFDPTYSVFYRVVKRELVAVAIAGDGEFPLGHRLPLGEGIAGWTATKQLPFTPEDVRYETGIVKSRNLATGMPRQGFSLCLPILREDRTLGVVLIGPSRRDLPQMREIARTIALIASVTITSAKVLNEQKLLAKTDGLTGALNKTHILARLRELIAGEGEGVRRVSVFLFDIDHFKHYNDTNGHLPGDDLLKGLSALVKQSCRDGEVVGRYGGEEFLLVMPGVGKREALGAAERIRRVIAEHPFTCAGGQPGGRVTVSGGVATWPNDSADVEGLIRCSDEALYEAKRAGRNRVFAYSTPELALGAAAPDGSAGDMDLATQNDGRQKPEG
jgi:diguanylate cyclase (GGDEF)-like protein